MVAVVRRPLTPGLARLRRGVSETWGLRDVTFTAAPGEAIALIGPSGSGKSTLLRAIAGLQVTDAGLVAVDDVSLDVDGEILVTGTSASIMDFTAALDARTPYIFVWVLGLSFLLLMVGFRSIVVPLKAILMNLLSVSLFHCSSPRRWIGHFKKRPNWGSVTFG
mgnify:CR=1 FL=1